MTIEEIRAEVQKIRDHARDNEVAHSMEDGLYVSVLRTIAQSNSNNAAGFKLMATEALKARDIIFDRWYA